MPDPTDVPPRPTGPSLRHVAALTRAAMPPMHPGGRPIVAGRRRRVRPARPDRAGHVRRRRRHRRRSPPSSAHPHRVPPPRPASSLAAADGTVATVADAVPPPELGPAAGPAPRVSVFLSVLDVHVQRIPVDGRVLAVEYRPGGFLSADLRQGQRGQRAQRRAARTTDGHDVGVVQIAGLLARRIVCDVARRATRSRRARRYGLIRFGSRVDTLPARRAAGPRRAGPAHRSAARRCSPSCRTPGPGEPDVARALRRPGVRLLPNAVTVLALCSGLSGVQFVLTGGSSCASPRSAPPRCSTPSTGAWPGCSTPAAGWAPSSTRWRTCVSFGVSPALVLYIWALQGIRFGWVVALVFAVVQALRLARFNTLFDDEDRRRTRRSSSSACPRPAGGARRLASR